MYGRNVMAKCIGECVGGMYWPASQLSSPIWGAQKFYPYV